MVKRIVITVEGGVARVAAKPAGIEVVVIDVDADAEEPVRISTEAAETVVSLDPVTALVLEAGGLPKPGTERARRLLGLAEEQLGDELADLVLAQERCPTCGSTNLRYGRNLTGCADCGWHEED